MPLACPQVPHALIDLPDRSAVRRRRLVGGFCAAYAALLVGNNTFCRLIGGWESWVDPPLHAWHLYTGGAPQQVAIEVTVIGADGADCVIDLDEYFAYRLPNRPEICGPEACSALLSPTPVPAHARLLEHVLAAYNRRHPPARGAVLHRLTWDPRTTPRERADRRAMAAVHLPAAAQSRGGPQARPGVIGGRP